MKWMSDAVAAYRIAAVLVLVTLGGAIVEDGAIVGRAQDAATTKPDDSPKSPAEALNVFQDAANFQNNGAFKLAVEEWKKFLTKWPKDPLTPKARHYLGVCYMQLQPPQYAEAITAFNDVAANQPKFELIQDTLLNLGWCQYSVAQGGKPEAMADAVKTFTNLSSQFPEGKYLDQALFYLGEAQYGQGNREEAIKAYAAIVANEKLAKSNLRSDALYALGVTQEEATDYAAAGKTYDTFLTEFAEHKLITEVQMRKAETVLQAGDSADAAKRFGEVAAVEGFALADHAIYRQAFCEAKQEHFAEAGELYAKIPTSYKDSTYAAEASMSAGRAFYRADKQEDAAKWFQTVVSNKGEDSPEASYWLCKIRLAQGNAAEAEKLATTALVGAAANPYYVHLKLVQADAIYEIADRKADSVELYLKLSNEHPDHELTPQALYNAAFAELELKHFDEAAGMLAPFLEKHAEHRLVPDMKYVAGESLVQLAKHAEAEKLFTDLVANVPEHASREQWIVRLGLCQYLQKSYDKTVATLSPQLAGLKTPALLAEAHYLIGASQFFQDQADAAVKSLQTSLDTDGKWRQADETLLLLARALRRQDKNDEAIAGVKRLIAEFPESGALDQAHFRYGEFAYAAGDYKTAAAEYDVSATKWPKSVFAPYAIYGKGWSQLKSAEHAAAVETFTALVAAHAEHSLIPETHFARAMCLRQTGKHAEAIADIDVFLASDPKQAQKTHALYERGMSEVGIMKYEDAVKTFEGLLAADKEYEGADKALYEIGWAYKALKDDAKAVEAFGKLAAEHGTSPLAAEAHFHVAEDLYDKKDYAAAIKEYETASKAAGEGELAEKAAYKLGWAHFQAENFDGALSAFAAQIAANPKGLLLKDGLFMRAECLFKLKQFDQALPAFVAANTVIKDDQAVQPEVKQLLGLHAGQSASQLKKWDEAIQFLSPLIEQFPESTYAAEFHYELGWAQQNASQPAAFASYEKAATKSRGEVGARARFMMGELKFTEKAYAEAVAEFQRCMFGYGAEDASKEVKNWQAKSGYEAGRCFDVRIKDAPAAEKPGLVGEAQRFYGYVVEKHADHELAAEAKKRLAELAKLK